MGRPDAYLPKTYGNSFQILQTKDYVAIRYEMVHETRIVPIEGRGAARPHNPPTLRAYWGDALGRWDGNTPAIETTNFSGKAPWQGSTDSLRTIERFTRTAPNKIEVTATMEDPHTWARPWSFSLPLTEDDGSRSSSTRATRETTPSGTSSPARARTRRPAGRWTARQSPKSRPRRGRSPPHRTPVDNCSVRKRAERAGGGFP